MAGLEAKRKEFRSQPGGMDAAGAASLGSWALDLEALVDKLIAATIPKGK